MLQKARQNPYIPPAVAIPGIFHKDGTRENGTRIIDSIRTMHDRSNGSGRRFCRLRHLSRNIKSCYAFHVFYDTQIRPKRNAKQFLERHFDIVNLSKIPTRRKTPKITDEPLIWRYFVYSPADKACRQSAR